MPTLIALWPRRIQFPNHLPFFLGRPRRCYPFGCEHVRWVRTSVFNVLTSFMRTLLDLEEWKDLYRLYRKHMLTRVLHFMCVPYTMLAHSISPTDSVTVCVFRSIMERKFRPSHAHRSKHLRNENVILLDIEYCGNLSVRMKIEYQKKKKKNGCARKRFRFPLCCAHIFARHILKCQRIYGMCLCGIVWCGQSVLLNGISK